MPVREGLPGTHLPLTPPHTHTAEPPNPLLPQVLHEEAAREQQSTGGSADVAKRDITPKATLENLREMGI